MRDISEAEAPTAQVRGRLLESEIQKQCVDWARKRGYWARKFSSISQRSVPDYLFSRGRRQHDGWTDYPMKFATEFKREDAKVHKDTGVMSTKAQVEEQEALRLAGWFVFECNDFEKFRQTVVAYEKENWA